MWRDAFVESDDLLFLAFILQELHGQTRSADALIGEPECVPPGKAATLRRFQLASSRSHQRSV
jgi:hypothetical protein